MSCRDVLITGFEPFGGETINPSWEAVRQLPERIGDLRLHKCQVPVVFGDAGETVLRAAAPIAPEIILCIGQAGGRSAVTPERVAINLQDARIPDNGGNQPRELPVVPGGPAAYFATVPVSAMARAIEEAGFPGAVSNTAGTYVCNDLLYTLLHHYAGTGVQVGFLHVPSLPEQTDGPSMPLADIVNVLQAALSVL